MAVALHQRVGVVARVVAQHKAKWRAVGIGPASEQSGAQVVVRAGRTHQGHRGTHFRFLAHPHVRRHLVAGQHTFNQQLQLAAGGFFAKQAGVDDLGVVEHQQITGAQQLGQIVKNAVYRRGTGAVQQTRAAALGCRVLGNQVLRQNEIEIAEGEGAASTWVGGRRGGRGSSGGGQGHSA